MEQIDIYKALDFIRDNAKTYAIAKANMIYMTEYRKTVKAELMAKSTEKTESAKETAAYSHSAYKKHLEALYEAVVEHERLRWLMVGAEAKIAVWRSLEASTRVEAKSTL